LVSTANIKPAFGTERKIWLGVRDDFRNWLGLGLQPSNSHEKSAVTAFDPGSSARRGAVRPCFEPRSLRRVPQLLIERREHDLLADRFLPGKGRRGWTAS
jgi:hypothetical protein